MNSLPSTKLICALLALSSLLGACGEKKQAAAPQAIPVAFKTITTSTLIESSNFVGTLQAVQRVSLAPQTDGRVNKIFVSSGQTVKEGQKILELRPYKQQEQVNQGTAQVGQAKADVVQAEAQYQTAISQKSKTLDTIAGRKADVAQAEAQLQSKEADLSKAQAEAQLAQTNYKRSQFLVQNGVQAQQDLDDKTRTLETNQAAVKSAQKIRDAAQAALSSTKEALNSAYTDSKIADKQIKEAQANVLNKKQGIVAAQSNVGALNQDLEFNTVLAPIAGEVSDMANRKVGDILRSGETFTKIVDNRTFNLNIYVPVERRDQLKVGVPVEIVKTDGTGGNVGKITFISPTVNQDTQAILTKVTFNNDGDLKDSQYVRVRIIWNKKQGVLVPTNVVTNIGGSSFVFIAEKDKSKDGKERQVAKQKPITIGSIQGQEYQVISGLSPGEQLIVSRIQVLSNNTPVVSEALLKEQKKGS